MCHVLPINMLEEMMSQEFRLKKIDKTKNYFLREIKRNDLMNKKHKKVCETLNYTKHFILLSTVTGHISISAFVSCKFCRLIKNLFSNCRNQKMQVNN